MGNPFCHIELNTTDLDQAKSFYSDLFDWKLQDMPMPGGTYTLIDAGSGDGPGCGGGMMSHPVEGVPSHWMSYIAVDDLNASITKVEELGGKVLCPRTEVPEMGWFAVAQDPTGAAFAMWESAKKG
ncbi:MAG: VOC family protein [Phycisphaerales bacterium JB063]